MSEKIIHAAIQINSSPILTGRYHGLCIAQLRNETVQGFVVMDDTDDTTRFVGRKEALLIATNNGQHINKHNPKDELLSEDLFEDKSYSKYNPNLYIKEVI